MGGRTDNILMRIVDMVYSFSSHLQNIILVLVLGRGYFSIFVAIAATGWAGMARLVRGQTLSVKSREFVEAARASGQVTVESCSGIYCPIQLDP